MHPRRAARLKGEGSELARKAMLTKIVSTLFMTPTTVNVVAVTSLRNPKPWTAEGGAGYMPEVGGEWWSGEGKGVRVRVRSGWHNCPT